MKPGSPSKLDNIVADARRAAEARERGYRDQALKIYPWICGRCAREFTRANLRELTVHHRDHDHNNNSDAYNYNCLPMSVLVMRMCWWSCGSIVLSRNRF